MSKLSPDAQAVWDAFNGAFERVGVFEDYGDALAAALRAAADQVVPEPSAHLPEQNCRWYRLGVLAYRHNLLAIAAELEGQP
jgi:hypothetical protein